MNPRQPAERITTIAILLPCLVGLLVSTSPRLARAQGQADASGDWAGRTSTQTVDRKDAGTGARWDHDITTSPDATASIANVKVAVDASKVRNIVGYRA